MSQRALQEYLEFMRARYREAGKFKKGKILDHVCDVTNFTRDHARRIMSGRSRVRRIRPGPKPRYGELVRKHLQELWKRAGYMGSKRLKAALPLWLRYYCPPDCPLEVKTELMKLSPATIDRILAPFRKPETRGFSTTRAGHLLKNRIPLKLLGEIVHKAGYVEADTVAHCGDSLSGEFINSITMTDLGSGWTENRAIWNKLSGDVLKAIESIEQSLPFDLFGFSCDNGTEFLNESLLEYFQHRKGRPPVQMTRSRAYKKNDNARVEQKNYTHVRQLFGYYRFDQKEWVDLMNEIYIRYWNPLTNFFHPTLKMIKKERVGSKIKKRYDEPKTPYQRLLDSGQLTMQQRVELQKKFQSLDPFILQFRLTESISRLKELYRRSREGLAA
jgi:hypothetical protein